MIDRLKALFTGGSAATGGNEGVRLAAAALLAEAAMLDGRMDDAERTRIEAMLAGHFGLDPVEAARLLAVGRQTAEESVQLAGFTRTVKDAFSPEDRVRMIEMLWEVAYADGFLHDYEANLVRRVSGLIFVSDQDSGAARKRVAARLGVSPGLA